MNILRHLPNTITCANLFCGCLAILKIWEGQLQWAAILVAIAAVLDFFDGFAARMLKAYSDIGKDLDSLADMVTFGVVPGFMTFRMISFLTGGYAHGDLLAALRLHPSSFLPYAGFVIIIFSALRLAKFNNDSRQSENFIGLPTPANAILICSMPLVFDFNSFESIPADTFLLDPSNMAILACLLSLLLITELPLFSLKFKNFAWKENQLRYMFLLVSVLLLVVFREAGIPLSIVAYILISFVDNIFLKKEV